MLIPTIHVPSVIGVDRGGSGHGGIDLGQPHRGLKALEARGRESNVTEAEFLAELRPVRTVGGVVGAALRVAPR